MKPKITNKNPERLLSQGQMSRVWRIHDELMNKQIVTCTTLIETLGGYTRRTVLRDLDFMKYSLNLPIDFDRKRKTYYYTKPAEGLPFLSISAAEMQALTSAQEILSQLVGDVVAAKLKTALAKITNLVGINALTNQSNSTSTVKLVGTVQPHLKHFEVLEHTICNRNSIQFVYRKLGQADSTKDLRKVHPYHLVFNKGRWYLAAYDLKSKAMRKFALTRIEDLKILKEIFVRQPDFNPDAYFGGGFGVIGGQETYRIEIEFDRWGADLLEGTLWHTTQHITPLKGGRILMTMQLTSLDEITNWIMSWGYHARVIAPVELRNRVLKIAQTVVNQYLPPVLTSFKQLP